MSTLQGKQINNTYPGLIKTSDESAIDGTLKNLQDGSGNDLPIQVSSTEVNFTGTVTGVPAGPQGPQGPEGPEGLIGPEGPQGPQGAGQVVSVVAGTNITVDATDPANPIVSAAGGGGGGTPPMGLDSLPGMAQSTFSELKSFRSWVATTGYGTGQTIGIASNQAQLCVFAMQEGEPIDYIRTSIGTPKAGATGSGAIYRAGKDVNGNLIATDKLYDLPTFDVSTTGVKDFDLSANPFVMPAGETYGCIIIAFSTDVADVRYNSYSNAIWSGNGGAFGGVAGATFYRAVAWHVVDSGIGATTFPASLASGTYDGETGDPIMVAINQ